MLNSAGLFKVTRGCRSRAAYSLLSQATGTAGLSPVEQGARVSSCRGAPRGPGLPCTA